MAWHLKANGLMADHESVRKNPHFISRDPLFDFLQKRYHRDKGYNLVSNIILPSSMAKAKIVHNDAKLVLQSLLTDPRVIPSDYLFFGEDNNPFTPPPANLNHYGDLNTGRNYLKAYNELIDPNSREVLLPCVLYIDGTATGQFAHLPITPVKIALGIHTRESPRKGPFMGNAGLCACH